MWRSITGLRRKRDPGRYARSLFVSLTLHAMLAAMLAIYIVSRHVPQMLEEVTPIVVTLLRLPPRAVPPPPDRSRADEAPEPAPAQAVPVAPAAPKPSASQGRVTVTAGAPQVRQAGSVADADRPTGRLAAARDVGPAADGPRVTTASVGSQIVTRFTALDAVTHNVETEIVPVTLPNGAELEGDPADVRAHGRIFASGRGLGAANAAGGGGYGSGGAGGSRSGVYSGLMRGLANGVVNSTSAEEVDIVFIVDTTHSMIDNVRGVTAYADEFVDILRWDGRKPRFGLVTFSDTIREPAKVRGLTSDSGEFRNWLHDAEFSGGGDLPESGLDAVMAAARKIKFRKKSHRYFVFVSDGPFHDRDYDGQSEYTLDEVIRELGRLRVVVDVVGVDHLPVKQLAWGTGGRAIAIPGKGYLEQVAPPLPVKANAALGVLSTRAQAPRDELYVFPDPSQPVEWYELRWRLLSPRGHKIQGEFVTRVQPDPSDRRITFNPVFDERWFDGGLGYYTAIYRVTDSAGKSSVLRRVMDHR